MGAAPSAEESIGSAGSEAPPPRLDALTLILDCLSNERAHINRLLAFVQRHCELFHHEGCEHSLASTEVHRRYCELYEATLLGVLDKTGVTPADFAILMKWGVARGSDEANILLDFALAADDYLTFCSMMRARYRQLREGTRGGLGEAARREAAHAEEMRSHIWGLQRKLNEMGMGDSSALRSGDVAAVSGDNSGPQQAMPPTLDNLHPNPEPDSSRSQLESDISASLAFSATTASLENRTMWLGLSNSGESLNTEMQRVAQRSLGADSPTMEFDRHTHQALRVHETRNAAAKAVSEIRYEPSQQSRELLAVASQMRCALRKGTYSSTHGVGKGRLAPTTTDASVVSSTANLAQVHEKSSCTADACSPAAARVYYATTPLEHEVHSKMSTLALPHTPLPSTASVTAMGANVYQSQEGNVPLICCEDVHIVTERC